MRFQAPLALSPTKRAGLFSVFAASLLAAAFLILACAGPARSSSDGWGYSWGRTKVVCITVVAHEHELVYGHVTSSMSVHNRGHFSHWVSNFRLKARLVATTAGLDYHHGWRTTRFPVHSQLLQDHDYDHYPMAVNTDTQAADLDWNVQIKQVWDRGIPLKDIVRQFEVPFDTSNCRAGKLPVHTGGDAVSLG
jgi:hypothetical protein